MQHIFKDDSPILSDDEGDIFMMNVHDQEDNVSDNEE